MLRLKKDNSCLRHIRMSVNMCVLSKSVVIDMIALKLVSSELPLSRLLHCHWPNIAFTF